MGTHRYSIMMVALCGWLGATTYAPAADLKLKSLNASNAAPGAFLSDKLALSEGSTWGQQQVRLNSWPTKLTDASVPRSLPPTAMPHFTWDNRFAGYWHLAEDGKQIITSTDGLANPLWQITLPKYAIYEMLGTRGIVVLAEGSDDTLLPIAKLEFLNSNGIKIAEFHRLDQVIFLRTVTADGEIGLIIGDQNAKSNCRFIRLSATGNLVREIELDGVVGFGSTTGLSLSGTCSAFTAFPGTSEKPISASAKRLLFIVPNQGEPTIEDIGSECGTRTVWLDENRLALLGGDVIRVWDHLAKKWALKDRSIHGETFLSEAGMVNDSLVTLMRDEGTVRLIGVDIENGKITLDQPLPADAELDQRRRTLYMDARGVRIVTKKAQFLVEKEAGR